MWVTELSDRKNTLIWLERAYELGYRYVVRELDSEYLNCYSLKPKRYLMDNDWGYTLKDQESREALPAAIIKNEDMKEINYSNRSATLITELIGE